MEPPQAKKEEPQGHRLNEMVQRVVIEVGGVQRDPRLLHPGCDEHEAERCNRDQDAPLPRACIRDGQHDQQEHGGREIENHRRAEILGDEQREEDRKSTRLNSSHDQISYAVFCLKKKKKKKELQNSTHKNNDECYTEDTAS